MGDVVDLEERRRARARAERLAEARVLGAGADDRPRGILQVHAGHYSSSGMTVTEAAGAWLRITHTSGLR